MKKRWKQILAAGMSAVMLTQPAMTYAADLTENMVVQNASGLENNDQISVQQENLANYFNFTVSICVIAEPWS